MASQYLRVAGHELLHFVADVKGQGQHFWSLQHTQLFQGLLGIL